MSSYSMSNDPYRQSRKPSGCFNCGKMGHYARECSQPNHKRVRREENYSRSPESDDRKRQRRERSYSRRRSRSKSPFQQNENENTSRYDRRKPYHTQSRDFRMSRSRSYGLDSQYSSSTTSSTHGDSPRYDKDQRKNYRSERKHVDPRRRAHGLYNKYFSVDDPYENSWGYQTQRQYDPVYNHVIECSRPIYSDQRDQEIHSTKLVRSENICNEEESWDNDSTPPLSCNGPNETISNKEDYRKQEETADEGSWD